jgi:7-carboxy-7-deazaguanine synthase
MDKNKILPIIDLHTCLQGEGKLAGVPHILVRLSGCNLRCAFKDSYCDTPYSSFNPEKGKYTLQDVQEFCEDNLGINHMMITGGEPCLHLDLVEEFASNSDDFDYPISITIETNGSIKVPPSVMKSIDLASISPKLESSIPTQEKMEKFGMKYSKEIEKKHIKERENISNIVDWIIYARDFQLKYVVGSEKDLEEIEGQLLKIRDELYNQDEDKLAMFIRSQVYLMPEGVTPEQISEKRVWLMEECLKRGFNYSDRLQILAYGNKREA